MSANDPKLEVKAARFAVMHNAAEKFQPVSAMT